jgi:hypothetical protein
MIVYTAQHIATVIKVMFKKILAWLDQCPTAWEWSSSSSTLMHIKVAMYEQKSDDDKK